MPVTVPYVLEDRTGLNTASDFDDLYDRIFFRVARLPQRTTTMIYSMNMRGSRHRDKLPFNQEPVAVLDFSPNEALGTISYVQPPLNFSLPMSRYLRKTSIFGGSLLRKFMGSDGREYKWGYRVIDGQEWSCTTMDNYLVAHYDLKPPDVHVFDVTGNNLTVYEHFFHLTLEIIASFTIMRHLQQHNL